MDVAGIAKNNGPVGDAELFELLRIARTRKKNVFVGARPKDQLWDSSRNELFQPVHDHRHAIRRSNEGAIMAWMGKVPRNFDEGRARQFFKGDVEIHFENQFFVIFQMNEKPKGAEAGQLLAEEPHVFARGPAVDDVGPAPIREDPRPFAVNLIKTVDGIILLAQA